MLAPDPRQLVGNELEGSFPIDRHERFAPAASAARPPAAEPSGAHHRPGNARRRVHRVRDRFDQWRGVRIESEWNGIDELAVLDDGAEGTPVRVVRNKLSIHGALVRSEERRVGKAWRRRYARFDPEENKETSNYDWKAK